MILVGLIGLIGAGKTTVAQRLVTQWGFARISYSDALKDEVARTLPWTLRAYLKVSDPSIRERAPFATEEEWAAWIYRLLWVRRDEVARSLLQEWGTELRRREDPEYWVRQWTARARHVQKVVADDVRFPNEAEQIRALGGTLVRVTRPALDSRSTHLSETALRDWTVVEAHLVNDGTLEDLEVETDRLAKALGA